MTLRITQTWLLRAVWRHAQQAALVEPASEHLFPSQPHVILYYINVVQNFLGGKREKEQGYLSTSEPMDWVIQADRPAQCELG